jgi:carbon storage regulator
MLVLTRKRGESIKIGEDILVTVLPDDNQSIRYHTVRVGIEAPEEILILRTEIPNHNQESEDFGNK